MAKVLVLYDSASGNTAEDGRAGRRGGRADPRHRGPPARGRGGHARTTCYWCDGLAVGSPTNMGVLSWKMKRFWDEAMAAALDEGGRQDRPAPSRRRAAGAAAPRWPASRC